ncbi:PIG-L deacetylase family protein [Dactylosporangium cerinum]
MAQRPLTLMAVHAHPDDEATGTGGVLARYAAEGVTTVLVTCTDGRCGDGPGGVKPGSRATTRRRWPRCAWWSSRPAAPR